MQEAGGQWEEAGEIIQPLGAAPVGAGVLWLWLLLLLDWPFMAVTGLTREFGRSGRTGLRIRCADTWNVLWLNHLPPPDPVTFPGTVPTGSIPKPICCHPGPSRHGEIYGYPAPTAAVRGRYERTLPLTRRSSRHGDVIGPPCRHPGPVAGSEMAAGATPVASIGGP